MVVRVAKRYHQRRLNFCVITFYDPQRAAITEALEVAMIPSECVYNVDSFQGVFHFFPRRLHQPDIPATTTTIVRKWGRLHNFVFSQNATTGIFEVASAYECRLNSLQEGNGYCYQQGLSTRIGEIYPSREVMPLLVPKTRGLARLENNVGKGGRASGDTYTCKYTDPPSRYHDRITVGAVEYYYALTLRIAPSTFTMTPAIFWVAQIRIETSGSLWEWKNT